MAYTRALPPLASACLVLLAAGAGDAAAAASETASRSRAPPLPGASAPGPSKSGKSGPVHSYYLFKSAKGAKGAKDAKAPGPSKSGKSAAQASGARRSKASPPRPPSHNGGGGAGGYGTDPYGDAYAPSPHSTPVPAPGTPGGYAPYPFGGPSGPSASSSADALSGSWFVRPGDGDSAYAPYAAGAPEDAPGGSWFVTPEEGGGYRPYADPAPTARTPLTRDFSCAQLRAGNVVESSRAATLEYTYEASVHQETALEEVLAGMKVSVARWLGSRVMECDETRRRRRALRHASSPARGAPSRGHGRRTSGAGLEIVGIDVAEAVWQRGKGCAYFAGATAIEGAACHVVQGGITLYLGKHDADRVRTRTLAASDADPERFEEGATHAAGTARTRRLPASTADFEKYQEEATEEVLGVLRDAMNAGASPFLENSEEEEYAVSGLLGLRYITGLTHGGEEMAGGTEAAIVGAATAGAGAVRSSKMETIGVSLLAVGLGALAALALTLVVARKRRGADAYNAFGDDDPGEDSDKGTDVADDLSATRSAPRAAAAPPSSPRGGGKAAYVVGEEGSCGTDATRDARDASFDTGASGNSNSENPLVDVHRCTSATCLICNGRATTFVHAFEDAGAAEPEGYEVGDERHGSSAHGSCERASRNEGRRPPAFRHPAPIARPYAAEDTVQF